MAYKKAADLVADSVYRLENGYLKNGVWTFDKMFQYIRTENGLCYFRGSMGATWVFAATKIDPVEHLSYYFATEVPAPTPKPTERNRTP